jgi:hypothetical protein
MPAKAIMSKASKPTVVRWVGDFQPYPLSASKSNEDAVYAGEWCRPVFSALKRPVGREYLPTGIRTVYVVFRKPVPMQR